MTDKQKGIGEQIFGEFAYITGDVQAASASTATYRTQSVPLSLIVSHPDNRSIHDDLVEGYAASIEREGLAHPPLVRKLEDGRYQLISGHHRYLAYRLLDSKYPNSGWDKLPVTIRSDCDEKTARYLLAITNIRNPEVSAEERAEMLEVLREAVAEKRKENPEALHGYRTNDILADLTKLSPRTIARSRAQNTPDVIKKPIPKKSEVDRTLDALDRAITRVDKLLYRKELDPDWVGPYITRLQNVTGNARRKRDGKK